jgi:hypothetical protein
MVDPWRCYYGQFVVHILEDTYINRRDVIIGLIGIGLCSSGHGCMCSEFSRIWRDQHEYLVWIDQDGREKQ